MWLWLMQLCATYLCGAMHWINREMHLIVENALSREGLDPASCPPLAVDGETTWWIWFEKNAEIFSTLWINKQFRRSSKNKLIKLTDAIYNQLLQLYGLVVSRLCRVEFNFEICHFWLNLFQVSQLGLSFTHDWFDWILFICSKIEFSQAVQHGLSWEQT